MDFFYYLVRTMSALLLLQIGWERLASRIRNDNTSLFIELKKIKISTHTLGHFLHLNKTAQSTKTECFQKVQSIFYETFDSILFSPIDISLT